MPPSGGAASDQKEHGGSRAGSQPARLAQRLASEPDWSALPELPLAGRTGFGLLAEMGRWTPPILADSESYTKLHATLVDDGRPAAFREAADVLAAGCAMRLVVLKNTYWK